MMEMFRSGPSTQCGKIFSDCRFSLFHLRGERLQSAFIIRAGAASAFPEVGRKVQSQRVKPFRTAVNSSGGKFPLMGADMCSDDPWLLITRLIDHSLNASDQNILSISVLFNIQHNMLESEPDSDLKLLSSAWTQKKQQSNTSYCFGVEMFLSHRIWVSFVICLILFTQNLAGLKNQN